MGFDFALASVNIVRSNVVAELGANIDSGKSRFNGPGGKIL